MFVPRLVLVRQRGLASVVLLLGALMGACGDAESTSGATGTFKPMRAGTLTVATSLPAPGFWDGDDADELTGGFEHDLGLALVERLGLERMTVVDVPFPRIVAGHADDYDLALSQVSITADRGEQVDFSEPYLTTSVGVVGRPELEVDDLADARRLRWGVIRATTEVDMLEDRVRPEHPIRLYRSTTGLLEAVVAGRVDVAALDFAEALAPVSTDDRLALVAQINAPQDYGVVLPEGSSNLPAVDAAIRNLHADGTLRDLRNQLFERYDVNPDDASTIRITD
jgi:polar amino acid transport system substrate-binding protein